MAPKTTSESWSERKEREGKIGREQEGERERDRCKDSYRENPMTRCLRDMTLFKVATGGFAFTLISRDVAVLTWHCIGTGAVMMLSCQALTGFGKTKCSRIVLS